MTQVLANCIENIVQLGVGHCTLISEISLSGSTAPILAGIARVTSPEIILLATRGDIRLSSMFFGLENGGWVCASNIMK